GGGIEMTVAGHTDLMKFLFVLPAVGPCLGYGDSLRLSQRSDRPQVRVGTQCPRSQTIVFEM
ncbi:hypothetical protein BaRGS_00026387, partial [Batillaria attramentaria]